MPRPVVRTKPSHSRDSSARYAETGMRAANSDLQMLWLAPQMTSLRCTIIRGAQATSLSCVDRFRGSSWRSTLCTNPSRSPVADLRLPMVCSKALRTVCVWERTLKWTTTGYFVGSGAKVTVLEFDTVMVCQFRALMCLVMAIVFLAEPKDLAMAVRGSWSRAVMEGAYGRLQDTVIQEKTTWLTGGGGQNCWIFIPGLVSMSNSSLSTCSVHVSLTCLEMSWGMYFPTEFCCALGRGQGRKAHLPSRLLWIAALIRGISGGSMTM